MAAPRRYPPYTAVTVTVWVTVAVAAKVTAAVTVTADVMPTEIGFHQGSYGWVCRCVYQRRIASCFARPSSSATAANSSGSPDGANTVAGVRTKARTSRALVGSGWKLLL